MNRLVEMSVLLFFSQARDNFIYQANEELRRGAIDAQAFLNRLTSQHDHQMCDWMDAFDSLAELEHNEIDNVEHLVVLQGTSEQKLCRLCCEREPNVVFDCRCQLMCEICFNIWANSATSRMNTSSPNNAAVSAENPLKCCFCRQAITNYIVART